MTKGRKFLGWAVFCRMNHQPRGSWILATLPQEQVRYVIFPTKREAIQNWIDNEPLCWATEHRLGLVRCVRIYTEWPETVHDTVSLIRKGGVHSRPTEPRPDIAPPPQNRKRRSEP